MALFPRKIDGRYMMLGRQDNENIWLLSSDEFDTWSGGQKIISPQWSWEFIQIGNCGSPIEIDEGWLRADPWGRRRAHYLHRCDAPGQGGPVQVLARTSRASAGAGERRSATAMCPTWSTAAAPGARSDAAPSIWGRRQLRRLRHGRAEFDIRGHDLAHASTVTRSNRPTNSNSRSALHARALPRFVLLFPASRWQIAANVSRRSPAVASHGAIP